jgi:hypothetical protein
MIPTYRTIERTEKENNMHTPGPWKIDELCGSIEGADGHTIAFIVGEWFEQVNPAPANARLIAAAPNLLEALQALGAKPEGYCFCLNQEQINNGHTGECIDAQQAIEKAKE